MCTFLIISVDPCPCQTITVPFSELSKINEVWLRNCVVEHNTSDKWTSSSFDPLTMNKRQVSEISNIKLKYMVN
jgi:hypothetical protein